MIKLIYTNKERRLAHYHAKAMTDSSNKLGLRFRSYKNNCDNSDDASYLGKLGEVILTDWLTKNNVKIDVGSLVVSHYELPSYNYDGDFKIGAKRLEIKTKACTSEPLLEYEAGTTRISEADAYIFTRINDTQSIMYFCGWIPTVDLKNKAIYRAKGTIVNNSGEQKFICNANEYLIEIGKLYMPETLIGWLKNE